jgi:hypothetical protein
MTKPKKKDSLVWLEELVEAAKAVRVTFTEQELTAAREVEDDARNAITLKLVDAVDGYRQAIKDEVEAELDDEEKGSK